MFTQLFLLLFIFAVLLLGSFHIGPISVRVICTVIMLVYIIFSRKRLTTYELKLEPLTIFGIFLFISLLCKCFAEATTGFDETGPFLNRILARFLVCYISYLAIDKYVNSTKSLAYIFFMFVIICALNDYATYLQYNGKMIGIVIGSYFSTSETEYVANISSNLHRLRDVRTAMPGIFGHGAINGYMTSTFGILSLYYFIGKGKAKAKINWIAGLILFVLALIGAFCCQERSGFGLLLIFTIFTFYKFSQKSLKFILPISIIFLGIIYYDYLAHLLSSSDIGRYSELTNFDEGRQSLFANAIVFISNNILFGGEEQYSAIFGLTPHNFILHAFIYSGIIGAIIIIGLYIYILRDSFLCIVKSKEGTLAYFFACALTIYMLNGLFHSSSLITGDVAIWILYACMLKGIKLQKTKLI